MALDDFPSEWILRIFGERNKPENIVDYKESKSSNVVHFAAWINYYTKAEELTFYNDEYDDYIPPKPEPKPRRRLTTDGLGDYERRIAK